MDNLLPSETRTSGELLFGIKFAPLPSKKFMHLTLQFMDEMASYTLLKEKYLVSTQSFKKFRIGFSFYRPVNLHGLLRKNAVLLSYPVIKLIKEHIPKAVLFKKLGLEELNEEEKNFGSFNAIYIPPGGEKVVIQVVEGCKITGYLKVGITEKAIKNICNEEETLKFLKNQNISSFHYPEILYSNSVNNKKLLYLSTPSKLRPNFSYKFKDVLQLWRNIFTIESRFSYFEDSPIVKDLKAKIQNIKNHPELMDIFERIKQNLKGVEIQTGLVHGDFKIWNIFKLKDNKFYVIDWEWSQRLSFPLWDLWTWTLSKCILSGKKFNKKKILGKAKEISTLSGYSFDEAENTNMFNLFLLRLYITLVEYGHKDELTLQAQETLRTLLIEK